MASVWLRKIARGPFSVVSGCTVPHSVCRAASKWRAEFSHQLRFLNQSGSSDYLSDSLYQNEPERIGPVFVGEPFGAISGVGLGKHPRLDVAQRPYRVRECDPCQAGPEKVLIGGRSPWRGAGTAPSSAKRRIEGPAGAAPKPGLLRRYRMRAGSSRLSGPSAL